MALDWKIDSRTRLVTVVADGLVTRADVDSYLDAVDGAGALAYRKLFDGTAGVVAMEAEELFAVGARFRSYHDRPVGPLAIVITEAQSEAVARLLGMKNYAPEVGARTIRKNIQDLIEHPVAHLLLTKRPETITIGVEDNTLTFH